MESLLRFWKSRSTLVTHQSCGAEGETAAEEDKKISGLVL